MFSVSCQLTTSHMQIMLHFLSMFLAQIEKLNCKGNTIYNQPRQANGARVEICYIFNTMPLKDPPQT